MNIIDTYHQNIVEKLNEIVTDGRANMEAAAGLIRDCVNGGHKVYFFGTGHSYMVGQEIFARAGGYAGFIPILENELCMNHAYKSTLIERTGEYANVLLGLYTFKAGDIVFVTSNSGRNALTIELTLRLKAMGVIIIAITSLRHSRMCESRHPSKIRLFEAADLVLDNCSDYGDASIHHNDGTATGPASTLTNCFILHCVVSTFTQMQLDAGLPCPVFKSSNIDCGDQANEALFQVYG